MIKRVLSIIAILSLLATCAWATTTTTTHYALPKPPLGTTGTADGYNTLLDTADTNLYNAITATLLKSLGTGKGTLVGFSAANTPGTLAAGTDGDMLMADAASTLGVKWYTPPAWPLGAINGGTGVAQASAASTLTISGAYATTLTVSNTTALTLPTSGIVQSRAADQYDLNTATPTPAAGTAGAEIHYYLGTDGAGTNTGLAQAATFAAPTGTPVQGQKLRIRINGDATPRVLDWNAIYHFGDCPKPVITGASKIQYIGFIYNATFTQWDCVGALPNIP
jgi:hypothetical protein